MGIGIGGDFPLSSVITAEYANPKSSYFKSLSNIA